MLVVMTNDAFPIPRLCPRARLAGGLFPTPPAHADHRGLERLAGRPARRALDLARPAEEMTRRGTSVGSRHFPRHSPALRAGAFSRLTRWHFGLWPLGAIFRTRLPGYNPGWSWTHDVERVHVGFAFAPPPTSPLAVPSHSFHAELGSVTRFRTGSRAAGFIHLRLALLAPPAQNCASGALTGGCSTCFAISF